MKRRSVSARPGSDERQQEAVLAKPRGCSEGVSPSPAKVKGSQLQPHRPHHRPGPAYSRQPPGKG